MLIVAALKDEIRDFKAKMTVDSTIHFKPAVLHQGMVANKEMALLITGIGGRRMKKGLEQALAVMDPKVMLLVGYAGGASPVVSSGSLILVAEIIKERDDRHFKCDRGWLEAAEKICKEQGLSHHVGNCVTVEKVINAPHDKADLGATYGSLALEMEGAAFAAIAEEKKIPWLMVKAILDPVEMAIPAVVDCCEPTGEPKIMEAAGHLIKNPKEMMQLPKLYYLASQARQAITKFLEGWISSQ